MTALSSFLARHPRLAGLSVTAACGASLLVGLSLGTGFREQARSGDEPTAGVATATADSAVSAARSAASGASGITADGIAASHEAMETRRRHLEDMSAALDLMAKAADMSNGAYPEGDAGIAERERDFVKAGDAYERAAAELDPATEAALLSDRAAGPATGWKADDLGFSDYALTGLGLEGATQPGSRP